ncbi:MAG: hypothetical protein PHC64_00965 [Candidatus Gastranaerophilales bacterium]|nr:hypothetical protein [Candidatus Gastranaerophilales bacterium]
MDDIESKRLSEITQELYSMTFILCGYCENYVEIVPEIAKLSEFSKILHKTSNKLFDLL